MPTSLALAVAISAGVAAGVFLDPSSSPPARWVVATVRPASPFCSPLAAGGCPAKWLGYLRARGRVRDLGSVCGSTAPCVRRCGRCSTNGIGGFDIDAIDTERHETPYVIEGRLTGDATLDADGATLRLAVDRVWLADCPEAAARRRVVDDRRRAGRRSTSANGDPGGDPRAGGAASPGALSRCRRARPGAAARPARHRARRHGQERRAGAGHRRVATGSTKPLRLLRAAVRALDRSIRRRRAIRNRRRSRSRS